MDWSHKNNFSKNRFDSNVFFDSHGYGQTNKTHFLMYLKPLRWMNSSFSWCGKAFHFISDWGKRKKAFSREYFCPSKIRKQNVGLLFSTDIFCVFELRGITSWSLPNLRLLQSLSQTPSLQWCKSTHPRDRHLMSIIARVHSSECNENEQYNVYCYTLLSASFF